MSCCWVTWTTGGTHDHPMHDYHFYHRGTSSPMGQSCMKEYVRCISNWSWFAQCSWHLTCDVLLREIFRNDGDRKSQDYFSAVGLDNSSPGWSRLWRRCVSNKKIVELPEIFVLFGVQWWVIRYKDEWKNINKDELTKACLSWTCYNKIP